MTRAIGLHLRYKHTPTEMIPRIQDLGTRCAQCFVSNLSTGQTVRIDKKTAQLFQALRRDCLDSFFTHGSYRINFASPYHQYHPAFEYEFRAAQQLGCTHYILHTGSSSNSEKGIDNVARMINYVTKKNHSLKLVLENTAFTAPSIGSNVQDFVQILEKIDYPDRLWFCIDTAHAHAAGYQIIEPACQEQFIELLDKTIGIKRIALLHLNNTLSGCQSHTDIHCQLDEGIIPIGALKSFALNTHFAHIPIILELPTTSESQEQHALALVKSWHESLNQKGS